MVYTVGGQIIRTTFEKVQNFSLYARKGNQHVTNFSKVFMLSNNIE